MHIVRVCPAYFPYYHLGGSVVADFELDKALVLEGHSVTVLTCKNDSDEPEVEYLSPAHRVNRHSAFWDIKYGISIGLIIAIFREIFNSRRHETIIWFGGVWNLLTVLGPFICRTFSINYIITPHGMLIPKLINMKSSLYKRFLIKTILKSHLEKAMKVHFTVDEERVECISATGASMKSVVFPLCLDLSKFDIHKKKYTSDDDEKMVISFIGRLTAKKRIDLVIDALSKLAPEVKSRVKFEVFGPDDEQLWDFERFTQKEIGVEINYNGAVFEEKLVAAYHEADIFILCSESENFAISVVEAAYSYCVPLLTKEVGVGKYFTDRSAVFSELDSTDISQKIETLVNDSAACKRIGIEARKVSEQFSTASLDSGYFTKLIG